MKHFFKINLLLLSFFMLAGCGKSFLDTKNPASIFVADFYTDSSSLNSALTGVYRGLQNVYTSGIYLVGDVATDNSYSMVTGVPNWDPLNIDATDGSINSLWNAHFLCIGRANSVIQNAENVTMGDVAKKRMVAEARFLRALCYFNMVRIWGKVPVVTTPFERPADANVNGRNEVDAVYTQIITDLSASANDLPNFYTQNNAAAGHATKAAVLALWGEVLLTQKKYSDAATKLNELVANETQYNLSLLPAYGNIFSTSNEMNPEIIFAVRYAAGYNPVIGSSFANTFLPINATALTAGTTYSGNLVHTDLRDAFETGDARKAASIDSFKDGSLVSMYTKKFLNPGGTKVNDQNNDWIVYRYADVLLLYAEALNGSSQSALANQVVSRVRGRAGLNPLSYTDQADLANKILHERRVELNMEGHRWFDLLRSGQLITTLTAYFKKYTIRANGSGPEAFRVLFPIPATEIQINPKLGPNNEGY